MTHVCNQGASHRTWVATGCTTVAISQAKCVIAAVDSHMWLEPILAGLVGYLIADLGSAVYHWAIDNYGSATTPFFGSQVEGTVRHHRFPWRMTMSEFSSKLHVLGQGITLTVLPIVIAFNGPILHGFIAVCSGCIMFSQQFHAWAHDTKSHLPPLVVALQDAGVISSRSEHAAHHQQPYNKKYCVVSGVWNKFLDENEVFEALEMILFVMLGVRPRSWRVPNSDWTQETENLE